MNKATRVTSGIAIAVFAFLACHAASSASVDGIAGLWWDSADRPDVAASRGFPGTVFRFCPDGTVVYSSMLASWTKKEGLELGPGILWRGTWLLRNGIVEVDYKYVSPPPIEIPYVPLGTEEKIFLALGRKGESLNGAKGYYTRVPRVVKASLVYMYCDESEVRRK